MGWSRRLKKTPDVPFVGKLRPSRLSLFVRETMPLIVAGRVEVRTNGDRLRRRLLDVIAG